MSGKKEFETLVAAATVAKQLKLSSGTLRRHSLIVEKVTMNPHYYARTKQKSRLYRKTDIADLQAMRALTQNQSLTLEEAARQIFSITEKPVQASQSPLVADNQMLTLLTALKTTLAGQTAEMARLEAKMAKLEAQNKQLLALQPLVAKTNTLPDMSELLKPESAHAESTATKRAEIAADMHKSDQEVHAEMLAKAQENSQRHPNMGRTLADMQLPKTKHWWQRFINI
ncbi:MAG: transcriptional regulator [Lactobacillus sp.]|nr:MerR family transcriptional regulator [Lactobacillus sp.]MDN6052478.1 MerR family transcriptional regulator [Lactobacillus sp.]